ncbi:MAG: SCP2 sterol-binding domain-containing protein [Desulfurococcales archaeon]|nr:SCP2 sterol-binding domain-containing protein [Desulfurococcales archaeon]
MPRFPSREWAEEYCKKLNESEGYRRSARGWVWPILFKVERPEGASPGFLLKLNNGVCEGVEWFDDARSADAPYILSARLEDWLDIINGKVNPVTAIVRRKLKLEKGEIGMIMRYPLAALEMVRAAQKVETIV